MTSAEAFTCDVFLSRSAKDKAVVRPLAEIDAARWRHYGVDPGVWKAHGRGADPAKALGWHAQSLRWAWGCCVVAGPRLRCSGVNRSYLAAGGKGFTDPDLTD